MDLKLEIELVPKTCWYSNLRKVLTAEEWQRVRIIICDFRLTKNKCAICNQTSYGLEAHEKWEYNLNEHTQKLIDILPLCRNCHKVKHWGLASLNGEIDLVVNHFLKVNNCTEDILKQHLLDSKNLWETRNQIQNWNLDISYLSSIGLNQLYEKYK